MGEYYLWRKRFFELKQWIGKKTEKKKKIFGYWLCVGSWLLLL
jgi:hypothetical protein|tara:strand:- start:848 stop:976 length:129 start_codon:yes stop_codon:yes gene_type:complete